MDLLKEIEYSPAGENTVSSQSTSGQSFSDIYRNFRFDTPSNFETSIEVLFKNISEKLTSTSRPEISSLKKEVSLENVATTYQWKASESFSARLLSMTEDFVIVELIVDKEKKITDDRRFEKSLFEGLDLAPGSLFKITHYVRPNSRMLQVTSGKGIVSIDDFPKVNFDQFRTSKLFK